MDLLEMIGIAAIATAALVWIAWNVAAFVVLLEARQLNRAVRAMMQNALDHDEPDEPDDDDNGNQPRRPMPAPERAPEPEPEPLRTSIRDRARLNGRPH